MLLKTALNQIDSLLGEIRSPYKLKTGDKIDIDSLHKVTKRLYSWCFPELSTENVSIVVKCKECAYYKRYKIKNNPKSVPFYACSIFKRKTDPDFFCKDGTHASKS